MTPAVVSDNGRALLLLCSSVAAARGETDRPFGPRGWARIAQRLAEQGIEAEALLGMDAASLAGIAKDAAEAELMVRLLARSGQLAFELDRLAVRGIGCVTLADDGYPTRLRKRLAGDAPPVLFVAGDASILGAGGVAVVGSRDADSDAGAFAQGVAASAARAGRVVVSGGARGIDQVAMLAAVESGGRVAGLLPEGIERRIREPSTRTAVTGGQAVLASPYHPGAGFTVGAAMARNKLIYALADVAVVVASAAESGGTWAGAVEALKGGWVPVFVRRTEAAIEGNRLLLERGALPLDEAVAPEVPDGWGSIPVAATPEPTRRKPRRKVAAPKPVDQPTLDLVD